MNDSYNEFQIRVARIYKKQGKSKLSRKNSRAIYKQGQDGYTVIRGAAPRRSFPWTGLTLIFLAFFGIKGALMANIGPDIYHTHVSDLAPATLLEQFRTWTMRPDPISGWVARQINSLS